MADERELAYFAGFFDGEGSIGIYKRRYVVTIANTDIRPLKRGHEIWGGKIYAFNCRGRRQQRHWNLYGHGAKPFLEDIRPFSLVKLEQIEVFLEALPRVPNGRGQRYKPGDAEVIDIAARRLRELKRAV